MNKLINIMMVLAFAMSSVPRGMPNALKASALRPLSSANSSHRLFLPKTSPTGPAGTDRPGDLPRRTAADRLRVRLIDNLQRVYDDFDPNNDILNEALLFMDMYITSAVFTLLRQRGEETGRAHINAVTAIGREYEQRLIQKRRGISQEDAVLYLEFLSSIAHIVDSFEYLTESREEIINKMREAADGYRQRIPAYLVHFALDFLRKSQARLNDFIYGRLHSRLSEIRANSGIEEVGDEEAMRQRAELCCAEIERETDAYLRAYPEVRTSRAQELSSSISRSIREMPDSIIEERRGRQVAEYMEILRGVDAEDLYDADDITGAIEAIIGQRPDVEFTQDEQEAVEGLIETLRSRVPAFERLAREHAMCNARRALREYMDKVAILGVRSFENREEVDTEIAAAREMRPDEAGMNDSMLRRLHRADRDMEELLPRLYIKAEEAATRAAEAHRRQEEELRREAAQGLRRYIRSIDNFSRLTFRARDSVDNYYDSTRGDRPDEVYLDASGIERLRQADRRLQEARTTQYNAIEEQEARAEARRRAKFPSIIRDMLRRLNNRAQFIDLVYIEAYEAAKAGILDELRLRHGEELFLSDDDLAEKIAGIDERAAQTIAKNRRRQARFDAMADERFPNLIPVSYLVPGQEVQFEGTTLTIHRCSMFDDYDPRIWDNDYFIDVEEEGLHRARIFISAMGDVEGGNRINLGMTLKDIRHPETVYEAAAIKWLWAKVHSNDDWLELYIYHEESVDDIPRLMRDSGVCLIRGFGREAMLYVLRDDIDLKAFIREREFHSDMVVRGKPRSAVPEYAAEEPHNTPAHSTEDRRPPAPGGAARLLMLIDTAA